MITAAQLIDDLDEQGDQTKAAEMAAYHKAKRRYHGVANPALDHLAKKLRGDFDVAGRVELARDLWQADTHEARILAAKLLTQARLRPDDSEAWHLIVSWVPDFDSWAIADHACIAAQKRLIWDPSRLDTVETWTRSEHMWARRAALVSTLPWTKQNHPKPAEQLARHRILGWAVAYVDDQDWFIQKALGGWLRDLSKHDPDATRAFLENHGSRMRSFARKEAARKLPPVDP